MNERQPTWLAELTGDGGRRLLRLISGRLIDPQQADDLAQEVYLRLLRMQDDGIIREPRAFALRVAANIAYEWRMLSRNRRPHSSEGLESLEAEEQPFDRVALNQQIERLQEALNQLNPRCRAVILMHRRDKLTREEIAMQLGISVGMVKKHLTQGLAVCQKYLADPADSGERKRT